MHTFCGKHNTIFHYNGDLSGDVIICNKINNTKVRINMEDLLDFQMTILDDMMSEIALQDQSKITEYLMLKLYGEK